MQALKLFFAYLRVSTLKQGEGVSLDEQRAAIRSHALKHGLTIVKEFMETETAAKRGRPVFNQMLKELKQGKAQGVIIHKIDRSARNLKDWADLGELIDQGIEVHFAAESLDLHTRGGRLSADIQAVVAADFIRNLKEETRKGFYGRLKQGLYPLPAPVGYLDMGKGVPKKPDPISSPLIRQVFEMYATDRWTLEGLTEDMHKRGLRNKKGGKVSLNGLHRILRNPFYLGLIRLKVSGEMFKGIHQPIIDKPLFDAVQAVFKGKNHEIQHKHFFLFRRLLTCSQCHQTLISETQKGHVYYRCHNRTCPQKTIREENVEENLTNTLQRLKFNDLEQKYLQQKSQSIFQQMADLKENQLKSLTLRLKQLQDRLSKLTDVYLEGEIEKEIFQQKKNSLLIEEKAVQEEMGRLQAANQGVKTKLEKFLELANDAYLSYKSANSPLKREMVKVVTSSLRVREKNVMIELKKPFDLIAERCLITSSTATENRTPVLRMKT